ncbi:hypothetical protein AB1Y20_010512 [Prymnesium parvum]|uniref:Uncharacterized protein n=1 Tax=Prymnesium parvum TaxID=97485 RepID=A0AB34IPG9_PRYPA
MRASGTGRRRASPPPPPRPKPKPRPSSARPRARSSGGAAAAPSRPPPKPEPSQCAAELPKGGVEVRFSSLPWEVSTSICELLENCDLVALKTALPAGLPLWQASCDEVRRREDAFQALAWQAGKKLVKKLTAAWLGSSVGNSMAWTADGAHVLSIGADNNDYYAGVWSVRQGCLVGRLDAGCEVRSVAMSGDWVVGGMAYDGRLRVWSLKSSTLVAYLSEHSDTVYAVAVNGGIVVSGSADSSLMMWSLEELPTQAAADATIPLDVAGEADSHVGGGGEEEPEGVLHLECIHELTGHTGAVFCAGFASTVALSGSDDNTAKVWSLDDRGACTWTWLHPGGVNSIASFGDTVATACDDKHVRTFSICSGDCTRLLSGHVAYVASVQFGHSDLLFSGDGKEGVRVWRLLERSGESISLLKHPKGVYGMAICPKDGSLATGCKDEHVRIWRPSILPSPIRSRAKLVAAPGSRGRGRKGCATSAASQRGRGYAR